MRVRLAVLICLCAVLLRASAGYSAETHVLTIAADAWCPINCETKDKDQGIGVDLARAVFEPLGYQVKYVTMPWARALHELHKGKIDMVVGANVHDDPNLVFPKHPIYKLTDDFYVLWDNPITYQNLDSLRDSRIGIIKDYGYGDEVTAFIEKQRKIPGKISEVSGEEALEQNIRKLLAKRIDLVIESKPIMDHTIKELHMEGKLRRIGSTYQGKVYVAFSPALPASKKRAELYDAAISAMEAEGKLAPLYKKYGLKNVNAE